LEDKDTQSAVNIQQSRRIVGRMYEAIRQNGKKVWTFKIFLFTFATDKNTRSNDEPFRMVVA